MIKPTNAKISEDKNIKQHGKRQAGSEEVRGPPLCHASLAEPDASPSPPPGEAIAGTAARDDTPKRRQARQLRSGAASYLLSFGNRPGSVLLPPLSAIFLSPTLLVPVQRRHIKALITYCRHSVERGLPISTFRCPGPRRMSCSYLLCTILLFVAVLLAITVTGTILLMNHYQAPSRPDGPPLISTNQDEGNALVTVERGDGSRINIFIDPNCPDYNSNFLRLEGVQTSLLHSLTDHDTDLKSVKGQDRALLVKLAEEVATLSAHASQLKMEYSALRQGQGTIGQEINTLQSEQGHLIQRKGKGFICGSLGISHVTQHKSGFIKEAVGLFAIIPPSQKCRSDRRSAREPEVTVTPADLAKGRGEQSKVSESFSTVLSSLESSTSAKGRAELRSVLQEYIPSPVVHYQSGLIRRRLVFALYLEEVAAREETLDSSVSATLKLIHTSTSSNLLPVLHLLLSESQINMVKVVNSVTDALSSVQKETGSTKGRLKADLQRAPVHSARPKGCPSGEGSRPRDCSDIYASGQREDGIYSVFPIHYPAGFQVYCDMTSDGGGWTVHHYKESLDAVCNTCMNYPALQSYVEKDMCAVLEQ
ncbi:hypothetical protein P4O66_004688 [Electrophorus voltai]|uniref:Fibrinogen C-terminal domain-containing protein n=1 Tax=Electrophorus voltai TaxID=2609070 RepID=A0AAD9E3G7_9TELE|nr:hypothetical protein P4O66_004688 [Electrophorus voltai]